MQQVLAESAIHTQTRPAARAMWNHRRWFAEWQKSYQISGSKKYQKKLQKSLGNKSFSKCKSIGAIGYLENKSLGNEGHFKFFVQSTYGAV